MADTVDITPGSGTKISTEEVTTLNGGAVTAQHVQRVAAALRTADGTAVDLPGDAANGLDVDVTRIAAGENVLGKVVAPDDVITITCTLDTNAYADGDVLFATQEIVNAARVAGNTLILQSVVVSDIDDQGQGFDLIFFNANTSLGTENSAPDIDDTEVLTVIGRVQIGSGSFYDLGGNRVACVYGIGLLLKSGASTSLYVAGVSRGTGTYTASGLQIQFGFLRN